MSAVRKKIRNRQFAKIWNLPMPPLPTVERWKTQQKKSEATRRAEKKKSIEESIANNQVKKAVQSLDDHPTAPPGREQYQKLLKLVRAIPLKDRARMRQLFHEWGFDRPSTERIGERMSIMQAGMDWQRRLLLKWGPRLGNARTKREPDGTAVRTEHMKPFYEDDMLTSAIEAELIEHHAMPEELAILNRTVLLRQLLKKAADGHFYGDNDTRPIGMCPRPAADVLRGGASNAAHILGYHLLPYFGHMATALMSGTEAVSTGFQLRFSAEKWTVGIMTDGSNAFCRCHSEDEVEAIEEAQKLVREDDTFAEHREEILGALEYILRDLVFQRTESARGVTVVDGELVCIEIEEGEIQGGLFSSVRYCLLTAMKVLRPLKKEFPEVGTLAIIDDKTAALVVASRRAALMVPKWCERYGELMEKIRQLVNPRKYKIAQHPDAIDTEWDLEPLLHLFPADPKDGSRPSIVRTATKLNGVGIGFETTEGIAERRRDEQWQPRAPKS
jgi:hypothetical protein